MDNIEITVFDEIKDYKEKIYFFNFRQWIFTIIIIALVVPTYLILKDKIGEEITSYIVIAIAGVLGFIGFVKIHDLPAEKIIPYWFRHYFLFAKPIHYMTDKEYENSHQKKRKRRNKLEKKIRENKKKTKSKIKMKNKKTMQNKKTPSENEIKTNELFEKLSKLSKEQRDALLKLLER